MAETQAETTSPQHQTKDDGGFVHVDEHGQTHSPKNETTTSESTTTQSQSSFEKAVASKVGENIKGNMEKTAKQGMDRLSKALSPEKVSQLQAKVAQGWSKFIEPSKKARKDVAIYGLPPLLVDVLTWYRPRVTALVALLVFLMYGLLAMDEYTVVGLAATVSTIILAGVVALRLLMPFVSTKDNSNKQQPLMVFNKEQATEMVMSALNQSVPQLIAAFAAVVNCEDVATTVMVLGVCWAFSYVANIISGMFLIFCLLLVSFTVPYAYVQKKNEFDSAVKNIRSFVHNTLKAVYDAIPKADMKSH